MDSKFEWRVEPFGSLFPNQDSTPPAASNRAILRDISAGTSDHRVRLVFRPASSYSGLDHSVSSVIPVITGPFRPCPSHFMRIRATDYWFPCDSKPYGL